MRTALSIVLLFALAYLHATPDAHARRRAKRADEGPYAIAVAPFDGDRAGGRTISEALELELELVETVIVQGDRWLRSDLRRAGASGYEAGTLRGIMKKRKVDILVRGRRVGNGIEVMAYGADGRPRFWEDFPLPDDPDESAKEIAETLEPVLSRWSRASVVEPPSKAAASRRPAEPVRPSPPPPAEEDRRVTEEDLFVDFDDDRRPAVRSSSSLPDPDDMPLGDVDEPAPPRRRTADREEPPRSRRALAEDDDTGRSSSRRRLGSDDADDDRRPLLSNDRDPRSARSSLSMADAVSDDRSRAELLHWLAFSVGGVGGGWYYEFAAARTPEDDVQHQLWDYGGIARVSYWPLEYVGLDAAVGARTFSVNAEGLPVVPTQLRILGLSAAASARARYPFKLGDFAFAPGARLGYRYWGSSVDPQTHATDGKGYTLLPGWQMHALSVGAELFGSYVYERWRVEAELHLEPLPFVRYEETPDNPAVNVRPLGGNGTLLVRIPIYAPVFLEVHASTTLALVTWEGGPGTRLSLSRRDGEGNRLRVDGGESLNMQFGGGLSVGAAF